MIRAATWLTVVVLALAGPAWAEEIAVLRALVPGDEGAQRRLTSAGRLGLGADGAPVVVAGHRLVKLPEWTPLTPEGVKVDAFSIGAGGVPFVVSGVRLGLIADSKLVHIVDLPASGLLVEASPTGAAVYVYGQEAKDRSAIYRLERKAGKLVSQKWVQVPGRIGSVRPVGDDIFFAVGDSVYRAGLSASGRLLTALVTTVLGSEIIDLEYDAAGDVLYLASRNVIRSHREGALLPVLETGGYLRLAGQYLFVLEASRPQVLVLERPELAIPVRKP